MRTLNSVRHTGAGRYPVSSLKRLLALPMLRTNFLTNWIPAYAGMTMGRAESAPPLLWGGWEGLALALLAALLLSPVTAQAADTRALKIIATDSATKQTGEVGLYNKSYAVIIGIDQYANLPADKQLTYAVKDAKGVADVLKRQYKFDKIITLYNKDATRKSITKLLEVELPKQLGEQDALFIFWAGHGNQQSSREGDIGYLIPYDGDPDDITANITMTEIRDTISKVIPAKHIFYVMDACYSGLLADTRSVDRVPRRDLAYLQDMTKERVRQVLTAGGK
ncbi:MAG: caspase family protein, partial [Gallionellaceae bacterium]|nr:caspase family protein [Gallionellaceae bacterium]